ncbi:response regulator of citrate/malate metabolism [Rheinheimera sp. A13L]|uniref:response regulator n=1 Tax=Rheinheimera sp. A13L TaxID=506534 RepID=UPI0002124940|nr:response regulator [Rheinheimera sp. A13L]EGM76440.1 response regulator of citrate/malate metabolism [Rheinheimera sp. A13L]
MQSNNAPVVLFIDDEQFLLNAYQRMFRQSDWQSLFCLTMKEAYAMLELHPIQLILCDYYLQDGTGAEFFRGLDHKYHAVKRVLLSGSSEDFTDELIKAGLVDQVLSKPCSKQQLSLVIEGYLASVKSASCLS